METEIDAEAEAESADAEIYLAFLQRMPPDCLLPLLFRLDQGKYPEYHRSLIEQLKAELLAAEDDIKTTKADEMATPAIELGRPTPVGFQRVGSLAATNQGMLIAFTANCPEASHGGISKQRLWGVKQLSTFFAWHATCRPEWQGFARQPGESSQMHQQRLSLSFSFDHQAAMLDPYFQIDMPAQQPSSTAQSQQPQAQAQQQPPARRNARELARDIATCIRQQLADKASGNAAQPPKQRHAPGAATPQAPPEAAHGGSCPPAAGMVTGPDQYDDGYRVSRRVSRGTRQNIINAMSAPAATTRPAAAAEQVPQQPPQQLLQPMAPWDQAIQCFWAGTQAFAQCRAASNWQLAHLQKMLDAASVEKAGLQCQVLECQKELDACKRTCKTLEASNASMPRQSTDCSLLKIQAFPPLKPICTARLVTAPAVMSTRARFLRNYNLEPADQPEASTIDLIEQERTASAEAAGGVQDASEPRWKRRRIMRNDSRTDVVQYLKKTEDKLDETLKCNEEQKRQVQEWQQKYKEEQANMKAWKVKYNSLTRVNEQLFSKTDYLDAICLIC
ncbi:hypothetical protein WJX73_002819 [Symbiochloris irregularis]|uniref:Uncharacterized protein n=1 Tax=Symbiochloris irregularis TaxID=706552 RepID=A0AAW1PYT4_9CHLO